MPTLLFENGPDRGSGLELEPGRTYSIGRDPRCEVVVRDDMVSRQHCKLKEFKGAWYIKDNASTNGILVNNAKVSQVEVRYGDKIQVGGAILTLLEESLDQVRKEKTLGGYRLRHRLGRGGMGTVFQALQVSLGREVALKVLSPHLVKDPQFVQQFFREARAAGQLNHPHIVGVYDVGQEGETYFYSMEYIDGGSLEDRLSEEGKISVEETIEIVRQAAMALEFAEGRHIVHRDIKPDNLMLTGDGRVKIADLGLALSLKETADDAGQPILGTPHFISPEQALRREVDIRSDIYSLGATMYRMLSGRTLFEGRSAEEIIRKAVREEPTPLRELNPEVPEKVATIVHRMIEKNPGDRYQAAAELHEDLEKLAHRKGKTVILWSAVGVAVLAVTAAIILAVTKPAKEIVIQKETDEASRKAAFDAMDAQKRLEVELEAVRAYYQKTQLDSREDTVAALSTWLDEYNYLPIPEVRDADRRRKSIQADLLAEAEAAEADQQRRDRKRDNAQRRHEEALASKDFAGAILAADLLNPEEETDPEAKQFFETLAEQWVEKGREQATVEYADWKARVEDLVTDGRLQDAIDLCGDAGAQFPTPPAELAAEHTELLTSYETWFTDQSGTLVAQLEQRREASLQEDLRAVVEAFGRPLRDRVLALDFDGAVAHMEAATPNIQSPRYRALIESSVKPLQTGAVLMNQFMSKLDDGRDTITCRIPGDDGDEVVATLLDRDADARTLRLRFARGVGSVTRTLPYSDFAHPDALNQLLVPNLDLDDEQLGALAELMVLLEVCRWAGQMDGLYASLGQYEAATGWNANLKVALGPLNDRAGYNLATVLRRMAEQKPAAADAINAAAERFETETRVNGELRSAMTPFLQGYGAMSWAAAGAQLRETMNQRRDSLMLRMVYGLIHAGAEFPLIAEE